MQTQQESTAVLEAAPVTPIIGPEKDLRVLLRDVLDRLVSFVSIISTDGRLLEINEAVVEAIGLPKDQILNIYVWESPALAFSTEAQSRMRVAFETAMRGKAIRYLEKYQHSSGQVRSVDINLVPNVEDGKITHVIGSGIDVTDLVEQEAELRRTEEEFRMLAESIPQKVWVTDPTGSATFFNQRWYDYTGEGEANLGEGWVKFLHEDDLETTFAAWKKAVETGGTYDVEYRLRRHDGEYRWHLARGNLLKDSSGQPLKWFGTTTDIHDQKMSEAALKIMSENLESLVDARTTELQEMNKELEAFSYSVSHDLRTPLRSIEGFSQAVLEDEKERLSERALQDLRRVVDSAQYMGRLIDDLLKLSRLSRRDLNFEKTSLTKIVHSVVARKREADPKREIDVIVHSTPDVTGDAGLLELVVENLISNAWKFTSKVEKPVIEFGTTRIDDQDVFFVRDNGVGFDMAYYNKLFGAFQRLHRASEFGGTGIGLATVRRILNRHGGKIWADAKLNDGAIFYFTLKPANHS